PLPLPTCFWLRRPPARSSMTLALWCAASPSSELLRLDDLGVVRLGLSRRVSRLRGLLGVLLGGGGLASGNPLTLGVPPGQRLVQDQQVHPAQGSTLGRLAGLEDLAIFGRHVGRHRVLGVLLVQRRVHLLRRDHVTRVALARHADLAVLVLGALRLQVLRELLGELNRRDVTLRRNVTGRLLLGLRLLVGGGRGALGGSVGLVVQ